jgi:hypothetical protein
MTNQQENQDEVSILRVGPDEVYQQDKAAIDIQVATAKAYPRNIMKATNNSLAIATIDVETAKTCTYSVPRGGKAITGPSVHLAKILAQSWGNLRIDAKVVAIGPTTVTSESVCFDLENNLAIKTQVKRSIVGKTGRFSEDMITVTGNAANSIAMRNAILSVIPKAIVDKVYNAARATITGDISDETKLIAKRKQVMDALKDTYGVTEAEVLKAVGKAAVQHLTGDDLITLIGIGTAIKDGDTSIDQAFRGERSKENPITVEELRNLYNTKLEHLTKREMEDAKRVIDNNETQSFKKLFTLLTSKTNE